MVETTVEKTPAVGGRDPQLWGFVACLLLLALTVSFGFEFRLMLEAGHGGLAIAFLALFFSFVSLITVGMIVRSVRTPRVSIGGRLRKVNALPVHPQVAEAVQCRARELQVGAKLQVLYLPKTWGVIDGYVTGVGAHQFVVITGGLMRLFFSRDPHSLARFRFLIDHELGHVAHGDTTALYVARATLLTTVAALPLKALLFLMIDWEKAVKFYAILFPRVFDINAMMQSMVRSLNSGEFFQAVPPDDDYVTGFLVATCAFGLIALASVYVLIVRRREFLADRFAIQSASDEKEAYSAMKALLNAAPLVSAPPQSFQGHIRWHPSAFERLRNVFAVPVQTINEGQVAGMLVAVIVMFRLSFGVGAQGLTRVDHTAFLEPISGFFFLLLNFIVGTLVGKRHGQNNGLALLTLCMWVSGISVLLVWMLVLIQPIDGQISQFLYYKHSTILLRAERLDWIMLILSVPVGLICIGAGQLLSQRFFTTKLSTLEGQFTNAIIGAVAALALLWLISNAFTAPLLANREALFEEYSVALDEDLIKHRASMESGDGPFKGFGLPEISSDPQARAKRIEDAEQEIQITEQKLMLMRQSFARHDFDPPFSLFLLWEGPFRSTVF